MRSARLRIDRRSVTSIPFVNGDFNGGGSSDIAVAVRPARETPGELNSEFPSARGLAENLLDHLNPLRLECSPP